MCGSPVGICHPGFDTSWVRPGGQSRPSRMGAPVGFLALHDEFMSIVDRLADADLLWQHNRREGALLVVLIAVAATARRSFPGLENDRAAFEAFMRTTHDWTIAVEHRGEAVDMDHLFYKWLRCELVHTGSLPSDLRIDDSFPDPRACGVRAGGEPDHTVLLSPGWYPFLASAVRTARVNAGLRFRPTRPEDGQVSAVPIVRQLFDPHTCTARARAQEE